MSNQIVISSGAKVRSLEGVLTGTSGIVNALGINVANGIPQLDGSGKILVSQLPNSVMEYKGTWNAATNTPTLADGTGNQGDVYLCNVAGTVNFGSGPIAFFVGDQVIYSGSIWQRASGATGTVTSVAITESGDSLNITGSPITTSGTINIGFNGTNLQYINGGGDLTTFPTLISSIGLSMPSAFSVANSPLTANGTIAVTGAGVASQYIRGDGTLANFPTSGGGGSSVAYYFNGSVNQGTFVGNTYYEMSKVPVIGTGTDFTINANGYISQFITDANDPALLEIPAGNWNFEMYFSASSGGGSPSFYVELYKYNGSAFTLIASSSAAPEGITNGTAIDLYNTALAVPTTVLTLTDRLAVRVYVTHSGRTITLHTENSHLCEVITTFSTGITALNGLTAQVQFFGTGTSGTDFNISSATATHTFNLPVASAANTGKLSSTDWSTFNGKESVLTFSSPLVRTTNTISIPVATTSVNGYLSSTDWTTFNNKQNALTNPITGTGATTEIAYFNGTTSITSEAAFNYDASLNRLGVNTSNPNATIGGNSALDSGYGLLIKTGAANYNGIGIAIDSTYGNLISTEKLGTATARNLTLLNQSGFVSLKENGNFGVNTLNPSVSGTGIDVYSSTSTAIRFHTATSGTTVTDGAGINFSAANNLGIANYEAGTIDIVTNGNSGVFIDTTGFVGINGATPSVALTVTGSIQQSGVISALLKTDLNGKLIPAVAGSDYQAPLSNIVTGTSAANNLAIWNGTTTLTGTSNLWFNSTSNFLGIGTNNPQRSLTIYNATLDSQLQVSGGAPSVALTDAVTGSIYQAKFAMATAAGHYVSGSVAGDFILLSQTGATIFATSSTEKMRLLTTGLLLLNTTTSNGALLQVNGTATFAGGITGTSASFSSSVTALSLVKSGGTSAQILAADGSVITAGTNITISGGTISSSGGGAGMAIGGSITSATAGSVLFAGVSGVLQQDNANFFWNDTNNRLGIGTTSPNGSITAIGGFDIRNTSGGYGTNYAIEFLTNATQPRLSIVDNGTYTGEIRSSGLVFQILNSSNNALTFGTNSTERMRITSGGNIGIGTSSPLQKLHVYNSASSSAAIFQGSSNSYIQLGITNESYIGNVSGALLFEAGGTERMRITSGGQAQVKGGTANYTASLAVTNATSQPAGVDIGFTAVAPNNTTNAFLYCYDSSVACYTIWSNGTTSGRSDKRLKKNIAKASSKIDDLMKLDVVNYEWNDSIEGIKEIGLIAQNVEEVFPSLVVNGKEDKDGNSYKQVKYSVLPIINTKAIQDLYLLIQEQQAQIEELKAIVATK